FIFASVDFSALSLAWPFEGREWGPTSTGAGPSSLLSRYTHVRRLVDQRQTFVHRCHRRKKPQPLTGRGKLAERIEVEFGPFRPAASRRAECFLVALLWVHLRQRFAPSTSAAAYPGLIPSFIPPLGDCLGAPNSRWQRAC